MPKYFEIAHSKDQIEIKTIEPLTAINMYVYIDRQLIGYLQYGKRLALARGPFRNEIQLDCIADIQINGRLFRVQESLPLRNKRRDKLITYEPGDILIACDNLSGLPQGYMGHSAIVVDSENMIESISNPVIRKAPLSAFVDNYAIRAHYRPKSKEMGEKAAKYAEEFLQEYNADDKGLTFYFTLNTPLEDKWKYMYCSKFIWICYHYGAGYTFKNDHLWFAPEDLYSNVKDNDDFICIDIHEDFEFHLNL